MEIRGNISCLYSTWRHIPFSSSYVIYMVEPIIAYDWSQIAPSDREDGEPKGVVIKECFLRKEGAADCHPNGQARNTH